ncbi:MAG TPA: TlpA disulfide reductase family protein [Acidimicrobiia bacterium]|nr:TlpA disulfide reductase family protein [Acidimicrobiia bacterium]
MPRLLIVTLVFTVVACGSDGVAVEDVPPLPPATPAEIQALLAESDRPVVLNVWASWCVPCRSEAPLLRAAADAHGDEIRFVGIDVRDDQDSARRFVAEFGLNRLVHYFDPTGAIPAGLGGRGVPITFFFAPGGEQVAVHHGVIDERALALAIDDLLRSG